MASPETLWFTIAMLVFGYFRGTNGQIIQSNLTGHAVDKVTVELLIICDMEFTARFQNNRQRVIDYWAVYLKDVNAKFKVVPDVDIYLKVTSLHTIQDVTDQPFVEQAKTNEGVVNITKALDGFSKWIYIHQTNFPNFDVAILATSANSTDCYNKECWAHSGGLCKRSTELKTHLSTMIIKSGSTSGYYGPDLPWGILKLLHEAPWRWNCITSDYENRFSERSRENRYFFSECHTKWIKEQVTSDRSPCLWWGQDKTADILSEVKVQSPSIKYQCLMTTEYTKSFTKDYYEKSPCVVTKCYVNSTSSIDLYPVDNSPCGIGEFCFRGRCLPQGHLLQNVEHRLCLHSTDPFSSNDHITLTDCAMSPTPLDQVIIVETETGGAYLATPFSPRINPRNEYKYVTVDKENEQLQYQEFDKFKGIQFVWDLIRVADSEEFLLFHRYTKTCAGMVENGIVKANQICDHENSSMRWRSLTGVYRIPFKDASLAGSVNSDWSYIKNIIFTLFSGIVLGMLLLLIIYRCCCKHRNIQRTVNTADHFSVSYYKDCPSESIGNRD